MTNLTSAPPPRQGKRVRATLTYFAIVIATLVVVDIILVGFDLFPPTMSYGDPDLGWRPAEATGHMALGRCVEVMSGRIIDYSRNEDGVRTDRSRAQLANRASGIAIGVVGDSHTDLCSTNEQLHSGVLESALHSDGLDATVFTYGAGKYSPVQEYLAYRLVLKPYRPQVLVVNLYTGNDFYDILRVDDRPHFESRADGYTMAPPVWYSRDDPSVRYRSRVLFALRSMAEAVGVRRLYLRVSELRRVAAQQGAGLATVAAYMRDLWKAREPAVGYPDAFTSQMLNQQLFFYHFPPSQAESIRRIRALMAMIKDENPGVVLVMSPIPSYQLAGTLPVDSVFLRTVARVPVSYDEGAAQERALYDTLRVAADELGWIFVDNLSALQAYRGKGRLYNDVDYHILPAASALIGNAQAAALVDTLKVLSH